MKGGATQDKCSLKKCGVLDDPSKKGPQKASEEKINEITARLSRIPLRLMEIRNREMHDEVLRQEGRDHNKKLCAYCCMEAERLRAERLANQRAQDKKKWE